tara:strand:+ start:937 stop:1278 length:342 start_codon:yes stop_codon:yes gene_type:complete
MAKQQQRHRNPVDPDADLYKTQQEKEAWARLVDLTRRLDQGEHPDSIRHGDLRNTMPTAQDSAWARLQNLSRKLDAGVHPDSIKHSELLPNRSGVGWGGMLEEHEKRKKRGYN